jgi:hypothetical protein
MAVDLKRIHKGKRKLRPRVLVYGFDGIGKTTFAVGSPNPLVLDANRGSHKFDVQSVDVNSWTDVFEWTEAAATGQVDCDTIVYDAGGDIEAMSHEHLFKGTTVTEYKGGFNKGDDLVTPEWRKLLFLMEKAYFAGKGIVIVAHARVKKFEDPQGPAYDRFELSLRPALAGLLRQWNDFVLFCREETTRATLKGDRSIGVTTGIRYAYTKRTPAYDAKARGSMMFPERIPLSWKDFADAIEHDEKQGAGDVERDIGTMLSEVGDEAYAKIVRDWVKQNPTGIVEARNRVAAKLDELRTSREAKGQE